MCFKAATEGIGVLRPNTWAEIDSFTCFGGIRWEEYRRGSSGHISCLTYGS
jgi:hypothetical protein